MTLAILLIIAAFVALIIILGFSASRSLLRPQAPGSTIEPVDIEAFRNLVDPAENEYLRSRLPAGEFRRVQRKRLEAAAAYVRTVIQNATLLERMAESATNSADSATSAAAQQMMDGAVMLRHNATLAWLRIRVAWAWPASGIASAPPILDGYNRLSSSAMLLGRLQSPATAVRIASPR
jgi:hypothetical protein